MSCAIQREWAILLFALYALRFGTDNDNQITDQKIASCIFNLAQTKLLTATNEHIERSGNGFAKVCRLPAIGAI